MGYPHVHILHSDRDGNADPNINSPVIFYDYCASLQL